MAPWKEEIGALEQDSIISVDKHSPPLSQYETCIQVKQTYYSYPQETKHQSQEHGELTHCDIWGPAYIT
ncbi:uncharacterized protein BT62DRAFT_913384 [Guyanagaster necrorhizus]|uniref:Uncharacterized protein n=1 Tax=Guyanagaster necrorhizus TaxID=856835 RepID=A0A9P7VG32_9AGAR|nr:uncharacterized protein BT62DRAFT_913384 [Guyanagaster necrorhizus MCA 3950]KAG7439496.1 hypothetical protein BT62DRAFT_913384 [Guyanagaster necrorhizus MCA 3950]